MKKTLINIFLVFILITSVSISGYSLHLPLSTPLYVPIDSLSKEHLYYDVEPDFKGDFFTYEIDGKNFSFKTKTDFKYHPAISADTIQHTRNETRLFFNKLVSFTKDSIYVSAYYQKHSIHNNETGKLVKIRSIGINKQDLIGLQLLFYPEGSKSVQNHLAAGYSIIPGKKKGITNHIVELGFSRITSHDRIFATSYYASNEFAFNKNKFYIGPKIGGQISFLFLGLGSEFVYYTDFKNTSLQWVPFFYLGFGNYKLHFDGRVPIYNKKFQNMNNFSIGFSMPIFPLSKRKAKL
ncbi:hypothetical protein M2132_000631 [Dysgonomonas sp. PH5-45]|uniref:hypothetical protein n=1 Tax=unclassified Dysgonomonas TaxID=2630389 RepID=UPI0024741CCD|nr:MULTISPECIES: hypothetical protein [unclassified Dysgonomonas]MDH6354303.1 hypothetical protein [Dysgonomonas sp. PH5-45]MDH6387204.1 hypothetical protein [Dysgonomonas sp. PH5-37]